MEVNGYLHFLATLPTGKNQGTHGIGGWVGLRAHLDNMGKIKLSCLYSDGLIRKSWMCEFL
jgi:hypothetical protein